MTNFNLMNRTFITVQDSSVKSDKFRVLIAIEKHEWSDYAFQWAINYILNPSKHRIYLLTITKDSPQAAMIYSASVDGGVPATTLDDIHTESIKKAFNLLRDHYMLLQERFDNIPMDCHCLIGTGDPRDQICQAVKKTRADLLIMGQRGSGWFKRLIFGSISDYCLRNAHCAVLIARDSPLPLINYDHPDALGPYPKDFEKDEQSSRS